MELGQGQVGLRTSNRQDGGLRARGLVGRETVHGYGMSVGGRDRLVIGSVLTWLASDALQSSKEPGSTISST